ncbi:MAG: VanZ family protein [Clostridia bacterium]|nr:VanZ family protein [Clostridia bacterium]
MKKTVYLIFAVICAVSIFAFSSQTATKSNTLSNNISEKIAVRTSGYDDLNDGQKDLRNVNINDFIRALAHIFLFACLGLFLALFVGECKKNGILYIAFPICFLYAIIDESYQGIFVDGRAFEVLDLVKDWSGSLFAILCVVVFNYIISKKGKF